MPCARMRRDAAVLPARRRRWYSAVGPPTSWMYPLNSGSRVSCFASSTSDALLRAVTDASLHGT